VNVKSLSSADKREKTVYGRMQPEGSLPLTISHAGGKHGDKFEPTKAREHTVRSFVDDFNAHKGDATKNVTLSLEGKKLHMEVDGKRFEAKSFELDHWYLKTFLKAEFEPYKREVRFWYDGEKVTPKFGQSRKIKSFGASEHGIEFTYEMNGRTITTRASPEFLKEKMPMEELSEKVRVFPGKETEGNHRVEIGDDLYAYAYGRITRAKASESAYYFERGGLGEDIGSAAFAKMGWNEVCRHPFDPNPGRDPHKRGTDALFLNQDTGELVLVEFRWWEDADGGIGSALTEVKRRKDDETRHLEYGEISGAYVASLSLSLRSNWGELRVKRAW